MIQIARPLVVVVVFVNPAPAAGGRNIPARTGWALRAVRQVRHGGVAYRMVATVLRSRGGFGVSVVVIATVVDGMVHGIESHPLRFDSKVTYSTGDWESNTEITGGSINWSVDLLPGVPRTFTRIYPDEEDHPEVPHGAALRLDVDIRSVESWNADGDESPKLGRVELQVSRRNGALIRIRPPKP